MESQKVRWIFSSTWSTVLYTSRLEQFPLVFCVVFLWEMICGVVDDMFQNLTNYSWAFCLRFASRMYKSSCGIKPLCRSSWATSLSEEFTLIQLHLYGSAMKSKQKKIKVDITLMKINFIYNFVSIHISTMWSQKCSRKYSLCVFSRYSGHLKW